MDTLLQTENQGGKSTNKILLVALLIGTLLVGGAVYLLSFTRSADEQAQELLAGSFLEGTPEFEQYTKDIVVQTDMDNITQAKTALGSIMMTIPAKIRNKGQRAITGLEVKVAVVDMLGKVLKEKKILVVPKQREILAPGQTIPVVGTVEGFREDEDRANVRWKVTAIRIE